MRKEWRKAAIDGDQETISRLLAEGVDINSLDKYGQTALMLAALYGADEVVRVLLLNGADKNVTAKYRLSALMLAVVNHRTDVAKQLIDAGADLSIRGSGAWGFADKTAHDLATDAGMSELAAYIARAGRLNQI